MMLYTCPYSGGTRHIYPTAHPDKYPIGYFGCTSGALRNFLPPDKQITLLQFEIDCKRLIMMKLAERDQIEAQEKIATWQAQIEYLSSADGQRQEARRLLAHRAQYLDKLTPRDLELIILENTQLSALLDQSVPLESHPLPRKE